MKPIALWWAASVLLMLLSGAFWAGRKVEQGNQLGQVLMLQQAESDLWAAIRSMDSVSMQYRIALSRRAQAQCVKYSIR